MAKQAGASAAAVGRRRITSRAELEQVAFDLFDRQGFERTTVGDIDANAALAVDWIGRARDAEAEPVLFPEPVSYTKLTLPTTQLV